MLFDYQLNRHCAKTGDGGDGEREEFDYQLNRHCAKTVGTKSPLQRMVDMTGFAIHKTQESPGRLIIFFHC